MRLDPAKHLEEYNNSLKKSWIHYKVANFLWKMFFLGVLGAIVYFSWDFLFLWYRTVINTINLWW